LEETGFRALSTCHYELVFADVTPLPSGVLLREAFSSVTRAEGAYRQACWLVEQFGGPPLFTQLRGRGGLLSRHAPYAGVTQEAGDRWLAHMETALSRQIGLLESELEMQLLDRQHDGIVLTDSQPAGSSGSRTFRTNFYPLTWGAV
jgi:truncated hemoglobin YjbI